MTTKDLFEDALKEAGHQSCQKFVHRPYSGAPLMANDGTTCVYLTPGAKSVCHEVKYSEHRPLCYCGEHLEKRKNDKKYNKHRFLKNYS